MFARKQSIGRSDWFLPCPQVDTGHVLCHGLAHAQLRDNPGQFFLPCPQVGTPRTHRRYLSREDGTYGPIPSRRPLGMLSMPFNTTSVKSLYCVGDSTFPGQGVNAVVFSGFGCAHRVAVDIGLEPGWPIVDKAYQGLLNYVRDRS